MFPVIAIIVFPVFVVSFVFYIFRGFIFNEPVITKKEMEEMERVQRAKELAIKTERERKVKEVKDNISKLYSEYEVVTRARERSEDEMNEYEEDERYHSQDKKLRLAETKVVHILQDSVQRADIEIIKELLNTSTSWRGRTYQRYSGGLLGRMLRARIDGLNYLEEEQRKEDEKRDKWLKRIERKKEIINKYS